MTWKKIIDTNDMKAFEEKANKQEYVYVLYSIKTPYLPIDFAFSLYEISVKYNVNLYTLKNNLHNSSLSRKNFTIKKVLTT